MGIGSARERQCALENKGTILTAALLSLRHPLITVRNVITCARFGVFISCTLQDAFINNIQLYGTAGTGVFFSKGTMRNIHISDVHYSVNCATSETFLTVGFYLSLINYALCILMRVTARI